MEAAIRTAVSVRSATGRLQKGRGELLNISQGSFLALPLDTSKAEPVVARTGSGSSVWLPGGLVRSLPEGSVLTVMGLAENFSDVAGGEALAAMSVSILDASGRFVHELSEPVLLQISESGFAESGCAFLDLQGASGASWSVAGVRSASEAELAKLSLAAGSFCVVQHFSIFAMLALGCTNVELFSDAGLEAMALHKNWWRTRASGLTFYLFAALLVALLLGAVLERRALRLGSTRHMGRPVSLCRTCVNCGPQALHRRYLGLRSQVKEALLCYNEGVVKLRKPLLIAAVQRCLAVHTGISLQSLAEHCWNGGDWLCTPVSTPLSVLIKKLGFYSGKVEATIRSDLRGTGPLQVLRRFLIAFLACHPLLDSLRIGCGSLTVPKRCTLHVTTFVGVLATNAMIFSFSGAQRSWEADWACPIQSTAPHFLLFVTLLSVLLNVLPNAFLLEVAKQVQERRVLVVVFWFLTAAYALFSFFTVLLALANLNGRDQERWLGSMRWMLGLKLLGVPLFQALRQCLLLEHLLRKDPAAEPFMAAYVETTVGLRHTNERELKDTARPAAQQMAGRSISAEQLVQFTAYLGHEVMFDYCPETSTSGEVAEGAAHYLFEEPSLRDMCMHVEVLEVHGLTLAMPGAGTTPGKGPSGSYLWSLCASADHMSLDESHLGCAVLHYGVQQPGPQERHTISERWSSTSETDSSGDSVKCTWHFRANLSGLELGHAIGFAVCEGSTTLGEATLLVSDVVAGKGFFGELVLYPPTDLSSSKHLWPRSSQDLDNGLARLLVRVELTAQQVQTLRIHELFKAFVLPVGPQLWVESTTETEASGSTMSGAPSRVPPEKMVVHAPNGNYCNMVTALLCDILEGEFAHFEVRRKLLQRDVVGLLDILGAKRQIRFWLDMFAVDQARDVIWHKAFLKELPGVVRCIKSACCNHMIADIRANQPFGCCLPEQLVVMDQGFTLLQESGCLSEVMLAGSMGLAQRLLIHSRNLDSPKLKSALHALLVPAEDRDDLPWAVPYTRDRQAVHGHMTSLVGQAAKQDGLKIDFSEVGVVAAVTWTPEEPPAPPSVVDAPGIGTAIDI